MRAQALQTTVGKAKVPKMRTGARKNFCIMQNHAKDIQYQYYISPIMNALRRSDYADAYFNSADLQPVFLLRSSKRRLYIYYSESEVAA